MSAPTPYRLGSLCSGYGGLEMALRLAGWPVELAFVADPDPAASKVLAHRHPDVPNLGDITRVDWSRLERVDLLTAGFPCTDISCAGRRAGLGAGTRSGVWTNVADAIDVLRPRLVLIENVAALLSTPANRSTTDGTDSDMEPGTADLGDGPDGPLLRAAGAVLGDLADIGYDAVWQVVSAAEVGAPHLRKRIFILAWPAADPPRDAWRFGHGNGLAALGANGLSLLPTPVAHDDGKSPEAHLAMKAAMPGGPRTQITSLAVLARADFQQPLMPTPNAALGRGTGTPSRATAQERFDQGKRFLDDAVSLLPTPLARDVKGAETEATRASRIERGTAHAGHDLPTVLSLLPTPTARDGDGRGEGSPDYWQRRREELGRDNGIPLGAAVTLLDGPVRDADRWGEYAPAIARWEAVIGRPAPDPTEPGTKGQPRLAARFVEWMQGLPDGHVTAVPGISRNDALKVLGNGVVPLQGAESVNHLAAIVAAVTTEEAAA